MADGDRLRIFVRFYGLSLRRRHFSPEFLAIQLVHSEVSSQQRTSETIKVHKPLTVMDSSVVTRSMVATKVQTR